MLSASECAEDLLLSSMCWESCRLSLGDVTRPSEPPDVLSVSSFSLLFPRQFATYIFSVSILYCDSMLSRGTGSKLFIGSVHRLCVHIGDVAFLVIVEIMGSWRRF